MLFLSFRCPSTLLLRSSLCYALLSQYLFLSKTLILQASFRSVFTSPLPLYYPFYLASFFLSVLYLLCFSVLRWTPYFLNTSFCHKRNNPTIFPFGFLISFASLLHFPSCCSFLSVLYPLRFSYLHYTIYLLNSSSCHNPKLPIILPFRLHIPVASPVVAATRRDVPQDSSRP